MVEDIASFIADRDLMRRQIGVWLRRRGVGVSVDVDVGVGVGVGVGATS